ncbi:translation initiation factor IF-2 [Variovorax sp. CCNWLW225]|jgi:hypothetical protein|uniref:translation initiation factor IF-2 n=1 Tax=unclassified Variovorax TaxID=663243 RepID=UPI00307843DD
MANDVSRSAPRPLRKYGLAAALLLSVAAAGAQPTGNPKGTRAPPISDSAEPQGARPADQPRGSIDQGPLGSDKGPASARTQTSRPPSTATPGGIAPSRDGDPSKEQRGSDKRHARPAPQ